MGKKLYKTSMVNIFRLVVLSIVVFFLNDFYLETFTHEKFQAVGKFKIFDVINYHFHYPYEFITFICIIIIPAIYYAFIRGVTFFEKGIQFNRGLPFYRQTVKYADIKSYKLLHPKLAISLHTHGGDAFIVADNNVERAIAILDQHHIQGDLAQDDYVRIITNYRKLVVLLLTFTVFLFVVKKLGLLFST